MKKRLQSMLALLCISLLSQAQNPTCIYTPYVKTFTPPLTASPGGNTIQNPTFESNILTNWTPLPNANRVKTASNGYNSNYCAKIISTTNAGGDAFMTQTITNLIPGNTYNLSAWLKSNLAVNNKAKSIDIRIRFNYPNGANQVISKSFFPTSTWTKCTNTFTVPNNVNLQQSIVQISMYRGQQDSMYVDDVELITPPTTFGFLSQEFPAPPVGDLIENFEDSTGNTLSNSKWLVVKKEWGNGYIGNNNGVVPENLELLCDGGMRFHGHGDLYNGPINGAANVIGNGKIRVGACIATKDYYASGRYEVVAKVTPGMVNAFWTFHYIEDPNFQNGGIKNSEIDWEFPSNLYTGNKHTITDGLCNTWGGLCDGVGLTTSGISYKENLNVVDASQDFHTYTIEWHTGDSNIAPSISWYFDSVLVRQETNPTYIPFRASRFWIGVWYGNTNWITGGDMSVLQYADKYMDVRSVKITPFYEANDIYENETVPALGFVGPSFYPTYPCNSNNQLVRTKQQSANSTVIAPSNLSNEITLFPTPTKAEINLSVSELVPDIITDITILDLKGQIIKHINLNNNTDKYIQLPLIEKLSSGFYMLKGQTNIGNTFTKKIIVE